MIAIEFDVERLLASAAARSLIFMRTSPRRFRKNNKMEAHRDWMRDRLLSISVLLRAQKCMANIQSNATYEN
jgi:hypothetical protein